MPEPLDCTCFPTGECIRTCTIGGNCNGQTLKCPAGMICKIECGTDACMGTTIECLDAIKCLVQCKGDDACKGATIKCGNSACELSCEDHTNACGLISKLECGPNSCTAPCKGYSLPPTIACEQAPCSGCPPKKCP